MKRLLGFFRRFLRHRRTLFAGIACIPLVTVCDIRLTLWIGDALSRLAAKEEPDFLARLFVWLLGVAALQGLFRYLARWISRERVPGVRIAPSRGEWGVFAPAQYAERARRAFRRAVAANNPGGHRVYFKIRAQDKYKPVRKLLSFGRATALADLLVKGLAIKATVLDRRGKVRFVAFKRNSHGRALPNSPMDKLADAAVMMAARGARQYLDVHKLAADPAVLTECLKTRVKAAFPKALDEVRDAISAGMHAVAEQTFAASMRLAGIEAAKEAAAKPSANANARGLVPMEVKGSKQADRLLKYLRKHGVRAQLRHVPKRPGWFGFLCPLSQEKKAEEVSWEWSRISDTFDRPTHKALAAEKRWRLRQRRRKHRRGFRKGGYMIGGKTLPLDRPLPNRRQARRNGPYYYTPKYRPPMVGNVPPGFTLVEAPRIGRWREDLPVSSYTFGVISYPTPVSDKDMERYELSHATPRAGANPRRARRNVRSYKTMSDAESWKAMQWMAKNDPTRYQIARRITLNHLQERLAGTGHGISSSDVNHTMVALIRMGDVTVTPGAPWRKRVSKNASIESRWPHMTERQRVEALRIVGIERDVADLWGYKTWEQLSSVVRQLLVRSWKHGGDTTKIRRAPVGVR